MAHIEKRFSMPWSHPVRRMREFILAMQAIWSSWQNGEQLRFEGEFYTIPPARIRPATWRILR